MSVPLAHLLSIEKEDVVSLGSANEVLKDAMEPAFAFLLPLILGA